MEPVILLLGYIFGVCLHEYGHAMTAWYGGDTTVEDKGYLDFNPFAYANPLLSVVLPVVFLLMGAVPLMGGAVYIERDRLRSRHWDAGVSAAGPAATLLFGMLLMVPFRLGFGDSGQAVWQIVAVLAFLQLQLLMLNLLPVPGLDGFGILRPYLPKEVQETSDSIAPFGIIIAWGLMALPEVQKTMRDAALTGLNLMDVPLQAVEGGWGILRQLALR